MNPKYNIGDKVWLIIEEGSDFGTIFNKTTTYKVEERTIKSVQISKYEDHTNITYGIGRRDMGSSDFQVGEFNLFSTKEELIKSL